MGDSPVYSPDGKQRLLVDSPCVVFHSADRDTRPVLQDRTSDVDLNSDNSNRFLGIPQPLGMPVEKPGKRASG